MDNFENALNLDRLLDVSDALETLQKAFLGLKMLNDKEESQAIAAALVCVTAGLCVTELASHLKKDRMDFYDALRATARGEMVIDPKLAKEFKEAIDQANNPMKQN